MRQKVFKFLAPMLLLAALLPGVVLAADFEQVGGQANIKLPTFLKTSAGPAGKHTFGTLVTEILSIMLLVIGSLSVLFLIIGGFRYVTASGNEEAAEGAKRMIWHSIVGLVLVIMAFAIITIITNVLVAGTV